MKYIIRDIIEYIFASILGVLLAIFMIIVFPIIYIIEFIFNNKIKCKNCGTIQNKANWDHQRCKNCSEYLYDERWSL